MLKAYSLFDLKLKIQLDHDQEIYYFSVLNATQNGNSNQNQTCFK